MQGKRFAKALYVSIFFCGICHGQFTLDQIPTIKNKRSITLVAEQGFWTDYLTKEMLPKFSSHTGVNVNVVTVDLDHMFGLQSASLEQGLGKYDLLTMEAGWSKEWASNGYTVPLRELAMLYDPNGDRAMEHYLEPYFESLLSILSYQGEFHAIPYNNYVMGNHYRVDLLYHPIEQASFRKRYGYALAPPENMQQLIDIAQFFTRSTGQTLAGKELKAPFFGVTLMSGNRPHINDEFSSILWSQGANWLTPVYNDKNTLTHFEIPLQNHPAVQTAELYKELKQFAAPADTTYAFNEAADAIAKGQVAMWPFAYNNLWSASFKVEQNIKGARLGVAQVPGGKPYTGAYAFAVSYDSRNPEAAYWLLKYMGSYEAQHAYALGGGNPCRKDVVQALEFQQEDSRHISGAFKASYDANMLWLNQVKFKGHFTSTAMGHIYPELTKACYEASQRSTAAADTFLKLNNTIKRIQNQHGELPVLE